MIVPVVHCCRKKLAPGTHLAAVGTILPLFNRHGKGLAFTHEVRVYKELQFLNITMQFFDDHVCWWYNPRAQEQPLPYESAH